MTNKEHPQAHILRAIADGADVQIRYKKGLAPSYWHDVNVSHHFYIFNKDAAEYRIKPKEKVKKYRFVYKDHCGGLKVSHAHYPDAIDFNNQNRTAFAFQRIDATMIEVEE